jgi:hypothetical protein
MLRSLSIIALFILATVSARGEEADDAAANEEPTTDEQAPEDQGDGFKRPKTLSGMSILGNEEAPKSLVIIPWKSSELGDDISLSDTLDERARPVDKEVFLRELSFYEIRSGEQATSDAK